MRSLSSVPEVAIYPLVLASAAHHHRVSGCFGKLILGGHEVVVVCGKVRYNKNKNSSRYGPVRGMCPARSGNHVDMGKHPSS